jgi:hypothetical protein
MGSKEVRNARGSYAQMPEVSGDIANLPNPSDVYNPAVGAAQYNLNRVLTSDPNKPPPGADYLSDFRDQGRDLINNAPGAQPTSQRPDLMGPAGPYQKPDTWGSMSLNDTGRTDRFADAGYDMLYGDQGRPELGGVQDYQKPADARYDYANRGGGNFDPNSVAGPSVSRIADSGLSLSGAAGTPSFKEALDAAKGFGGSTNVARENLPGPVGRENIQGSGFAGNELFTDPNSVASRGFNASLAANQGLANDDVTADTSAMDAAAIANQNAIFARAGLAGRNAAGARGFTSAEGTVAGGEMGTRIGEAALAASQDTQQRLLDAKLRTLGMRGENRRAGASGLTSLGGTASEAGARTAGLLQNENETDAEFRIRQREQDIGQNETAGGFGVTQRGQDIQNAQFGAGQGSQNLSGVASLINATGGQGTDYERMKNERARLGLDTGKANQEGELGGYNAQTGRMTAQGDIASQGRAADTAQFGAETTRGLGEEAGRRAAEAQGLDWNTLDANQRMELNRSANTRYQTDVTREGQRLDAAGNLMQTSGQQGFQERELEQNARQFAASLGKDYDALSAQERNDINTQANQRYQTDVAGELGRGEQTGENYRAQLAATANMYSTDVNRQSNEITQQRDQLNNAIQTGQLANDVLSGKQSGQQAANALVASGLFQDQNAALQFVIEMTRQEQNRWQTNRADDIGPGDVMDYYSNMSGAAAAAVATSDVNLKENFALVDGAEVLARIEKLAVSQWNFKGDNPGVRHIGPMAQDFHEAFPLNADDTHINLLDCNGVLLAAVKELAARVKALEARL